jgi:hypothetical protein
MPIEEEGSYKPPLRDYPHPLKRKDEVFITNLSPSDELRGAGLGWKNIRIVNVAYNMWDEYIPRGRAVFASRTEVASRRRVIPGRDVICEALGCYILAHSVDLAAFHTWAEEGDLRGQVWKLGNIAYLASVAIYVEERDRAAEVE